jgi:hypothetical protein
MRSATAPTTPSRRPLTALIEPLESRRLLASVVEPVFHAGEHDA